MLYILLAIIAALAAFLALYGHCPIADETSGHKASQTHLCRCYDAVMGHVYGYIAELARGQPSLC